MAFRSAVLGVALVTVACGDRAVDWSKPENFILREKSVSKDDGAQLEYWSLVDAACQPVYDALQRNTSTVD